ncbi:LAMI_0B05710g1_1 [Lachancea mirantina]|uniref:LAMI_0B05710g1_1 n=1 Tax=Lachancea mirantina TaxID=1230905 RepID=A0A1G4IW82_9SACH|nr:LAMI_0B05710g1_1 [Lachancea mirantina]
MEVVFSPSYNHLDEYFDTRIFTIEREIQRKGLSESLEKLYELIICMIPLRNFDPLFGKGGHCRVKLEKELEREVMEHPELDLEVEPRYLVKSLTKNDIYDSVVLTAKIRLIVLAKTLMAFLDLFDNEFANAFFEFRWILQFMHEARKCQDVAGISVIISSDHERSLSIWCARTLIDETGRFRRTRGVKNRELKINRLDVLEGILVNILDCTSETFMLECIDELDYFMMDRLFTVIGDIERNIAFLKGPVCELEEQKGVYEIALRAQRAHIDSMVRKHILASTFKLPGDVSIVSCMDKILEGLLLYGGVHLPVIDFFYKVMQYYRNQIQNSPGSNSCERPRSHIKLVNEIVADWRQMVDDSDAMNMQCPQTLMKIGDRGIVMIDEVFEESENDHNHDLTLFLSSVKLRAKKRFYGVSKVQGEFSKAQWHVGISWIKFWESCYLDNQRQLPRELAEILHEFNLIKFSQNAGNNGSET